MKWPVADGANVVFTVTRYWLLQITLMTLCCSRMIHVAE